MPRGSDELHEAPPSEAVLLIEDSDEDAKLLERLLRATSDCHVERVGTLAEGGRAVDASRFDLLILDNHLPDGSAAEFLQRLTQESRRQPQFVGTTPCPVVVLTGAGSIALAAELIRLGAGDYLDKSELQPGDDPERPRVQLCRTIERAREHHRLTRRNARLLLNALVKRRTMREAKAARVAAERVADDATRQLRHALDAGQMGTWSWHVGTDEVTADPRVLQLFDLDASDNGTVPVDQFFARIDERDRQRVHSETRAVIEGTAASFNSEFRIARRNGDNCWIAGIGRRVDANGESRLIGVNYDVNDRHEQITQLRQSQEANARRVAELEATYREAPAGLALLDTDLKFTKINTAMPRLIGLASADWIGRLAQEALPDHVWRQVEHASRGALEDGVRKRVQIDLALGGDEGKPDEVRTILWNCSPVFAAEGGSPLGLNVVVQDVTDLHRKEQLLAAQKAELERQQSELNRRNEQLEEVNERAEAANQNLAETSGRLRSLLAGAPVGFGFFDRTARLVQHNAQLTSMTGLGDKRSRIDDTDDPSLMEEIRQHLRRVFATGHPVIGTELGASLPHDGMGPRWFLASFFPAGEPLDGEVAAAPGGDPAMDEVESFRTVGCVLLDITDRKRSERMLREAKENAINARISADRARELAEQANRAKSEFLAVLSHELRTPLTPVVAGAQMLASVVGKQHDLESDDTRSMIVETLDTMRRNVELEVRLIDDLLDLTRIARGKLQLTRRPSDLNEVVQHAVDICEQDVFDKRLDLKLDVTSKPLGTVVDPARIQQVVWNLIKNAVKFTEAEGSIAVRTFTDDDGKSVCCSVTDDGLGIEPSRLRSIFDAFEQGGPGMNRTFGGLGLGLAISRHLADAHGGSLVAHSEGLGRGATFTLRLPAKSLRQRGPSFNAPDARSDLSVGRILLVEDHDDTSKLMSRFLQLQFEAKVVRAGSVGEGRRLFDEQSFDLIISDIGLPDGNGTDLLSSLPHNHPPAIALSGYGTETDVRRSREAGFSEHLVKPVDLEQLESTVRKLVNGR